MLCEDKCDAGGPNRLSETIGNLGLWTELGIPTKATRFKTHHLVRFCLVFAALLVFVLGGEVVRGGLFLFYSGCAIPTQSQATKKH